AAHDADKIQNGEDSHDSGISVRRQALFARECTYQDFMKCKPLYFKGTEGVVELTQWFERMETTNLRKKMINKYCPIGEIKKLKGRLQNLRVKSNDMVGYNQCFQELALLFVRMFPEESDKVERYVSGLPNAENKQKFNDTSKNKQNQQQQQNKRQNIDRAYTTGSGDKKPYGGSKPLCPKINYYHDVQKPTCIEYRAYGHFKRECPKLKNNNQVNQAGNGNTSESVCARPCRDKPRLKRCYGVDLMPVELGSFDAIIGMDWLARYQAVIVCAEKIVRIPWGNETLIISEDGSDQGNETFLNIISCTKTQKYMLEGWHVFLAHVTAKETKDKSKKKRLEEQPIVQDFPEVFPEDLPGLPSTR
nr:reverse transcriptase domain-containing protein [Tanacetum cinerariifolium]